MRGNCFGFLTSHAVNLGYEPPLRDTAWRLLRVLAQPVDENESLLVCHSETWASCRALALHCLEQLTEGAQGGDGTSASEVVRCVMDAFVFSSSQKGARLDKERFELMAAVLGLPATGVNNVAAVVALLAHCLAAVSRGVWFDSLNKKQNADLFKVILWITNQT